MKRGLILEARTENLDTLLEVLRGEMEKAGCPAEKQVSMEICAEEIFVNIAHYAYAGSMAGERTPADGNDGGATLANAGGENVGMAHITVETDKGRIAVCFQDQGIPYDPLAKTDPDTSLTADERQIGGLGIFMVKNMMDEVSYEYKDGFNCLTMVMRW